MACGGCEGWMDGLIGIHHLTGAFVCRYYDNQDIVYPS